MVAVLFLNITLVLKMIYYESESDVDQLHIATAIVFVTYSLLFLYNSFQLIRMIRDHFKQLYTKHKYLIITASVVIWLSALIQGLVFLGHAYKSSYFVDLYPEDDTVLNVFGQIIPLWC